MKSYTKQLAALCAGLFTLSLSCAQALTQPISPRIVDGTDTTPQAYPSYVAITAGGSLCGGTLIDARWVLTAAHCLEKKGTPVNTSLINVYIQPTGISGKRMQASARIGAELFYIHPGYSGKTLVHDIALIKLKSPASSIPTALNNNSNALVGLTATVVGLGDTTRQHPGQDVEGKHPEILQKTQLPIVDYSICRSYYGKDTPAALICAGYSSNAPDACFGDSGGPLYLSRNGQTIQIGVVSFGAGCGVGKPGSYVDISQYESYIKQYVSGAKFTNNTKPIVSDVTGTWYDPSYDGVGFNFVLANNTLTAIYYGYRENGSPQWLASTSTYDQDIGKNQLITLNMNTSTVNNGATFTKAPNTPASGTSYWGILTLQFNSCSQGIAILSGADGTVTYRLTKLANPKNLICTD